MIYTRLNRIALFIALILLALLSVQVIWIKTAFRLKEKELLNQIDEELARAAQQIEEQAVCFNLYARSYLQAGDRLYIAKNESDSLDLFNIFPKRNGTDTLITDKMLLFSIPATADITMRFQYQFNDTAGTNTQLSNAYDTKGMTLANYRERLSQKQTITSLLDTTLLDSLIQHVLLSNQLPLNYRSGIKTANQQHFDYQHKTGGSFNDTVSFTYNILKQSTLQYPYQLSVIIPSPSRAILKSMVLMLGASALIVFTLIGLFAYFIHTILRQKKHQQLKTDFISNMTHEFRTPLTNISLALENLEISPENLARYKQIIEHENSHMQQNVERILQLSLIEKNEISLSVEPVDVHHILHEVAEVFDAQLKATRGKVLFDLNAPHCTIQADETHLINIFYNLMDNAIKYRSKEPYEIVLKSKNDNTSNITIQIIDHGIGMSKAEMKQIFGAFYRAEVGNIHNTKGFGIGLSYVKSMVQAHHGQISVSSIAGEGSTFTLIFPLA